jgi:hypothetical protein
MRDATLWDQFDWFGDKGGPAPRDERLGKALMAARNVPCIPSPTWKACCFRTESNCPRQAAARIRLYRADKAVCDAVMAKAPQAAVLATRQYPRPRDRRLPQDLMREWRLAFTCPRNWTLGPPEEEEFIPIPEATLRPLFIPVSANARPGLCDF